MSGRNSEPIEIFFAYSHEDEALRNKLAVHLSTLKRQRLIEDWHDRRIEPGQEWDRVIDRHLNSSEIILLLISADFIASDYCYGIEMKRALERQKEDEARVIPVILRPCDWTTLPFGKLQALPKDGKPVTAWANQDEAFTDIVRGVRAAVEVILQSGGKLVQPQDTPRTSRQVDNAPRPLTSLVVTNSPRAAIWNAEAQNLAYIPVQECRWSDREILLELEPDDPTDGPFLNNLRGMTSPITVAHGSNASVCRVQQVTHISKGGLQRWRLALQVERSEFQPVLEMAFQGISADEIALKRARRLLFNDNPASESQELNDITFEVFLQGMETQLKIERSVLPFLFKAFGQDTQRFLEIAWIDSAMRLKLSGCVVEVATLRLELESDTLKIQFHGKRRKEYVNRPAYEMKLEGRCALS